MSFVEEVMTYFKATFHQQPEEGESDIKKTEMNVCNLHIATVY
jgi:hypothetical protein